MFADPICATPISPFQTEALGESANFDLKKVPVEDHGKFYSGDCYVILYTYFQELRKLIYMYCFRL